MQVIRTHNAYHLGDNLVHLHFLRKIAIANPDRQFVHYAQNQYQRQLRDVISDVPNIKLDDYGYTLPSDSINSWRGHNGDWYSHPDRNDFVEYHLCHWFPKLAGLMGVENPCTQAKDMLFDYPAIQKQLNGYWKNFDVLVINSPPGSGQFSAYSEFKLTQLAYDIANKGFRVVRTWHPITGAYAIHRNVTDTQDFGLSISDIGNLSLHCHTILMVSTGPSWPTFNVWNQDSIKQRIILLEPERVNLSPNTTHCATIDAAEEVLRKAGLL